MGNIRNHITGSIAFIYSFSNPNDKSPYGRFSMLHVVIKDLDVRTHNDPNNLGVADINYWVVEVSEGAVEKVIRNGGASIQARRIGSAPARTKKPE